MPDAALSRQARQAFHPPNGRSSRADACRMHHSRKTDSRQTFRQFQADGFRPPAFRRRRELAGRARRLSTFMRRSSERLTLA